MKIEKEEVIEKKKGDSSILDDLEDQTSVVGEPLGVARHTGESSGETLLASSGSAEADDSDLIVCASCSDKAQWAARVTVARSLASGSVNAENIVGDDIAVNGSAGSGGDAGNGNLAEFRRDATGSIRWFAPSSDDQVDTNVGRSVSIDEADRRNAGVEGDWRVERDDGHVTSQSVGVPVGVDGEAGGRDGDLARLVLVAQLSTESQREGAGTINAVSSSQDVGSIDQGTTTEIETVNADSHLPREFTRSGDFSTNDLVHHILLAGTAESLGVVIRNHLGWWHVTRALGNGVAWV